ncbi:MAG: YceI family protein [Ruegeria sp.]
MPYKLNTNETSVEFSYVLSGVPQSGTMPISNSDIRIDTSQLTNSRVSVSLDVTSASTKLPFARSAMLSPEVLDAAGFPTISFKSTRISLGASGRLSDGATITGDLTVRGVTRPITLQASLYRQRGSTPEDLSTLFIRLTGALNRNDFGASGYSDLVGDLVGLDIRAKITREP